ncbi:hypothetical protein [Rhodobacter ferrooxidans]|uniref:Uncharacterized protein n=1 Tax=Rhodobacter ferrooxidans TaxID=371731 RepID=C8S0X9_9RHOB|nr:hypothetical protein [Rhodobacter sp. SW2]EEW25420.1 conserved hypothetical protein [Rhodobacter sp. SW2]
MSPGPGHNGGPGLAPGFGWRRHCWQKARADLLPHLPIEVLRNRVRRAGELGLDYRTYASVRAASGHDVIALLFSSNALRLLAPVPVLPAERAAKLAAIAGCGRLALAQRPLTPLQVAGATPGLIDAAHVAPLALGNWRQAREALRAALGKLAPDGVLLVGDHGLERDWCAAGRLAGYLAAERYFGR